jgi:hypothetical protein
MTPPVDSATHCERDDSPENCEIEITQEMIDAGILALDDSDYGRDQVATAEGAVVCVIKAVLGSGGYSVSINR